MLLPLCTCGGGEASGWNDKKGELLLLLLCACVLLNMPRQVQGACV